MPGIPSPKVSTGTIASTSNPVTPVGKVTVTAAPAKFNDTGTNAPVVTLQQSQATSGNSKAVAYDPTAGISSADLGATSFIAQPDPNAGISSADLGTTAFIAPQNKPGAAAAPADNSTNAQTTSASPKTSPGRNKYFPNDYYMDDLEITNLYTINSPSNTTLIKFKVVEPNGITLMFNLTNAIRDFYGQNAASIATSHFVMVIRFYGWDEKGNLLTKIAPVPGSPGTSPSNANAVVVKYIPFCIKNLTFKNVGKAIEYTVEGYAAGYRYAQTSALGSIPHPYQFGGETVGDVLVGSKNSSTAVGDDSKRATTSSPAQPKSPQNVSSNASTPRTLGDLKNLIFNPFGSKTTEGGN
jgi:hypothetical protein